MEQEARRLAGDFGEGVFITETCGLKYYGDRDDPYSDRSGAHEANILIGGIRAGNSGPGWSLRQEAWAPVIDATNFQPKPDEAYFGQIGLPLTLFPPHAMLRGGTRPMQIVLSLALQAASQNDLLFIMSCRSIENGAIVVMTHPLGMTTLILVRQEGDLERYRLYQSSSVVPTTDLNVLLRRYGARIDSP